VGASAGGLEAFSELVSALPENCGVAVVLIQHLDPTHESMLSQILSRNTQLAVSEATDQTTVEPNHVYVIPANADLSICNGVLQVGARTSGHMMVDSFLRALAEDRADEALGVVLSGNGSDGALGIAAIKAAGGVTFAEDPRAARFDGMPRAAIGLGDVDFVLPPAEIGRTIALMGKDPRALRHALEQGEVQDRDGIKSVLTALSRTTGLDLSYYKPANLNRRIRRRMLLNQVAELEGYAKLLAKKPDEALALSDDIMIGVTAFFRDGANVEGLSELVFPQIPRSPEEPVRIWVPGCATGEEAYSIAICLCEYLEQRNRNDAFQIFATDINNRAVERAPNGSYSSTIANDISNERLRRFFIQIPGGYQISRQIRERCTFARHNLVTDPPFSRLDLVSCHNVLIYLRPEIQERVLATFYQALKPSGFLAVARSENGGQLFAPIGEPKHGIFAKRTGVARVDGAATAGASNFAHIPAPRKVNPSLVAHDPSQREFERALLEQYAPPAVMVDEDLEILQFRGGTGAFLEPAAGKATLNLIRMSKESIRAELQSLLYRARQYDRTVRSESFEFSHDGQPGQLNIEVVPLRLAEGGRRFLVTFEKGTAGAAKARERRRIAKKDVRASAPDEQEMLILRQELERTKAQLHSIIDNLETSNQQLKSANEEVLSSNEELQSMNEELQTSKEELQSTNEELTTLNDELHNRYEELSQTSSDLSNVLGSMNVPILILSRDLRIRRFTPTATRVLNVIAGDVGRPIGDITLNIHVADLESMLADSIDSMSVKEQEVQDREGHWYVLRIRPYRTLDDRIDGAVLVLIDIDDIKRSLEQARAARDYAEAIVETVGQPLLVLDVGLKVRTANQAFHEVFQTAANEIERQHITHAQGGVWNLPLLIAALEAVRNEGRQAENLELVCQFPKLGERQLLINARRLEQDPASEPLILLAIEDVTLRESEARFRLTFEQAAVGMALIDSDGRWLRVNERLCAILGYPREEMLIRTIDDVIYSGDLPAHNHEMNRLLSGERGAALREERYVRKDGGIVWVGSAVVLMRGTTRETGYSILVMVDITERKHAQQKLDELLALEQAERRDAEQARAAAEAANRAKDHFLAMISHELRSPLQGIVGRVEIIRHGVDRPQLEQALEAIDRAVARQAKLVKDLLDISSIVSGKIQIERRLVSPARIAERALQAAMPTVRQKRLELSTEISESGNVLGDEDRLEQVFTNLLNNAIEFTPDGGAISLRCASLEGQIEIRIEDSGEGIAPEFISKAFERFSQADPTIARRHGGLGLGLAIAHTLVELHGGTIEAASPGVGRGTSITLRLPLAPEPLDAVETKDAPSPPSSPPDLQKMDVLLVEDDADLLEALAMTFEAASARVRSARSATEALAAFGQQPPDVLISDIAMPDRDGLYLVTEIRKVHGHDTPAIALTGLASGLERQAMMAAGFDVCVNKPIAPQKLIELAVSLVQKRRRPDG
jgi:PAS domain S-box-containing protein